VTGQPLAPRRPWAGRRVVLGVTGAMIMIVAVLVGDMGASLAVTANALRLARVSPEG